MFLTVKDLYQFLDNLAPLKIADKKDNNGLQIGSFHEEVKGILLAVNPTYQVFKRALNKRLNLVITHHPLFYNPITSILKDEYPGTVIALALKEGLNLISWHTPLDKVSWGVSECLAQILGWRTKEFVWEEDAGFGYGRVAKFKNYVKLGDLAKQIKEILKSWVMLVGDPEKEIDQIGICGGSGAFLTDFLKAKGIETLLTSDVKYHQALWAKERNFNYLIIEHSLGEFYVLNVLREKLEDWMREKGIFLPVEIFKEEPVYLII